MSWDYAIDSTVYAKSSPVVGLYTVDVGIQSWCVIRSVLAVWFVVCVVWSTCYNKHMRSGRSLRHQHRHLLHVHSRAACGSLSDGSQHVGPTDSPADFPNPLFAVIRLFANTGCAASSQSGMTLLCCIRLFFCDHLQEWTGDHTDVWTVAGGGPS